MKVQKDILQDTPFSVQQELMMAPILATVVDEVIQAEEAVKTAPQMGKVVASHLPEPTKVCRSGDPDTFIVSWNRLPYICMFPPPVTSLLLWMCCHLQS